MQRMQALKRLIILLSITRLSIQFLPPRMIRSQEKHVLTGTMVEKIRPRLPLLTIKLITLASGEYIFEYVGQGADGDELYAEVMDSEGNIIAKGDNVTLTGWKNWKTPSVSFKLEKETKLHLLSVS